MDLSKLEQKIDSSLRRLLTPGEAAHGPEFLEIHHAVLEEIGNRVQSIGGGRRVFPFNHLIVQIPVPAEEQRPYFREGFAGERFLGEVQERIREQGGEFPRDLAVDVEVLEQPLARAEGKGFHVEYRQRTAAPAAPAPALPAARFTLSAGRGKPVPERLTVTRARTNIGRIGEVLDQDMRMVRRNDVVFAEGEDPAHETVSRQHAHLTYDSATGEHRVIDDQSAHGTWILRDGVSIPVPRGSRRGERLQPGDELHFGQASLLFGPE